MPIEIPKKIDLKPKRHHGFYAFLFLMGMLLPPIAVAFRFGIGSDFFINVFLCICGYFPCHFHNFYIQNIRNNSNRARTPKWATRYGLVDNSDALKKQKKSQWAKRYDERNAHSTLAGAPLEDGEEGANYDPAYDNPDDVERIRRLRNEGGLWTGEDEEFYNPDEAPNQRHWHYPANFEGAVGDGRSKRGKGGASGDRWERTRAAQDNPNKPKRTPTFSSDNGSSSNPYPPTAMDEDVPEWGKDYGSKSKKSKKQKKKDNDSPFIQPRNNGSSGGYGEREDDVWGNDGGANGYGNGNANGNGRAAPKKTNAVQNGEPNWDHEF